MDTTKRLRDVVPTEFHNEHMHVYSRKDPMHPALTPAAKLLDVEVVIERTRTKYINDQLIDNPDWKEWPGAAMNVHCWWELANGKAVGWNESLSKGWSFPVVSLKG